MRVLPASRHFAARRLHVPSFARSYREHFRDSDLPWIYATAFLSNGQLRDGLQLHRISVTSAIVTFGFFGAHSLASSWVGRRALEARAQASSLYLFSYYLGSTVVGTLGGLIYAARGWGGLVAMTALIVCVALAIALRLRHLRPISTTSVPGALLS